MQIDLELQKILKLFHYIVSSTIMGGENAKKEKARLRKGCNILVCTPGRLLYHLQNTAGLKLDKLQHLIFDEADRMLDMGFEREMNDCLSFIKKKVTPKFLRPTEYGNYHSDSLHINFISATLSPNVQRLGEKLMAEFSQVGFDLKSKDSKQDTMIGSIPKQVEQYWVEIPTQYRLMYLLMFLFAHQDKKVIVFASTCETVNLLAHICKVVDWRRCVNKRGREEVVDMERDEDAEVSATEWKLFDGKVYKLHGDMDHSERKVNFFGFDKAESSVLVCTDVASRGLDFKHVDWILQWDLSSNVKEYVNRVGRTARIASQGKSLCFVMPGEREYVAYVKQKFEIVMHPKNRH